MTEGQSGQKKKIFISILIVILLAGAGLATYAVVTTSESAENKCPIASFTCPHEAFVGESLIFDASASSDPDGSVSKYSWNFGDQSGSTAAITHYAYAAVGKYNVTLVVTDDRQKESEPAVAEIEIYPETDNICPVAVISDPTAGIHGNLTISFDGEASYDPDGSVVSWNWIFDDGDSSNLSRGMHTYASPGSYDVSLVVTDDNGTSSFPNTVSITIDLTAAPEYSLHAWCSPSSMTLPVGHESLIDVFGELIEQQTSTIYNVTTDSALSWTWVWSPAGDSRGPVARGLGVDGIGYLQLTATTPGSSCINITMAYYDATNITTYVGYFDVQVTVLPAVVDHMDVTPAGGVVLVNSFNSYIATVYRSDDSVALSNVTYQWNLSTPALGTLFNVNQRNVSMTAGIVAAQGNLTCMAVSGGITLWCKVSIQVITCLPEESVTTRIYDMFNVPFGSYWQDRYQEAILHDTFPYTYVWYGSPVGNNWIQSAYRVNVTARNISAVNSTSDPWYVPVLSPMVRGGNIELDWTANYIDYAEMVRSGYEPGILTYYDSWMWRWNGTVTMDRTAAKMVLNMSDSDFDDFAAWKAIKFAPFVIKWSQLISQQMNDVWAIKFAYQYEGNVLSEEYDITKVGDSIVFQIIDHLSWGMESLFGRWWSHTFMQFEGWPEDVHFSARIGPMFSDFYLDMAVQYSLVAQTPISGDDTACAWAFENTHADAAQGTFGPYASELNDYVGQQYWCSRVANADNQQWHDYDYTPWAYNLGANDALSVEWPSVNSIIGYRDNGTGNFNDTYTGHVDPLWIEPVPGDAPANVQIDYANRTVTFTGPFDMLDWSMNTLADASLMENWSRTGILPRGCPYIEFVVNNDANLRPVAVISAPSSWPSNSSLSLASASFDVDGTIASYYWTFGDGFTSTSANPTHTWTSQGNFTVFLNVTDDEGRMGIDARIVRIIDNLPPIAVLTGSIYGNVQSSTLFIADSSFDQDTGNNSTLAQYQWDFGDGDTDVTTASVTTHWFAAIGTYNVTLTVVDDKGATGAVVRMYVVSTDLCAKIAMAKCASITESVSISGILSLTFSAPTKSIVNWSWEFGDGTIGFGQSVSHAWFSVGMMQVNLTVTDNTGWVSPVSSSRIAISSAPGTVTGLSLSMIRHSLLPSESTMLTISAVNGAGKIVTSFTGTVDVAVNGSGAWTNIPYSLVLAGADNGVKTLSVSCSTPGQYNITAAMQGSPDVNGSAFATVNNRTVEIKIYDIFEGVLPDYWEQRYVYFMHADEGFHNYTPVVDIYRATGELTAAQLMTIYTMSVEARNVPEYNMSNPTFAGLMNPTTGKGNATVKINFHFMTQSEVTNYSGVYFSVANGAGWDGWEYFLTGNVTMDREAAEQMINLPQSEADPLAWWAINNITVKNFWRTTYLGGEGGTNTVEGRLSVRACEDYYCYQNGIWGGTNLYNNYRLVLVDGGKVALNYKHFGYGEDALLSRFLHWGGPALPAAAGMPSYPNGTTYGILPFEPWFENMSLTVDIHEKTSNVSLIGGISNGFRAWMPTAAPADTAAWRWEPIRLDYLPSAGLTTISELDIWALDSMGNPSLRTYLSLDPGSSKYGEQILYDYAPAVTMLKPGESFWMEAPRVLGIGYLPGRMVGDPSDTSGYLGGYYAYLRVLEKWGNATIHPIGCTLGTAVLDKQYGDLTIVGPFIPIIQYIAATPWLWYEPAPRIELWIQ